MQGNSCHKFEKIYMVKFLAPIHSLFQEIIAVSLFSTLLHIAYVPVKYIMLRHTPTDQKLQSHEYTSLET